MKRFLEWLGDAVATILLILFLAVTMFPFDLYFFCDWLFNR